MSLPEPGRQAANRGVATEQLRRHNLSAVLERLHLSGPCSRSELAAQTGLNRSTIRDLIGLLVELGLVSEDSGTTSGGPGRPSAVAQINPAGAVAISVDLQVDYTALATIGLGGHIFGQVRVANPPEPYAPEDIVAELERLALRVTAQLPPRHTLVGVGAAVAGVVRRDDGFLHVSPNHGWFDVPLGSMIAAALGVDRVLMANEADAGALAEQRRGAARGVRHLIHVSGEVGVGVGIIHNGHPMLGTAGYAGEAGHNVVNPAGRSCRCGSTGCWETEVGEEALARHAGIPEAAGRQGVIDEILRRAHSGDPEVYAAFRAIGSWLGLGVGNLINTFNPELVTFGGFYHHLYPFLEQPINEGAQRAAMSAPWNACTITRGELGVDARLIGAAELVFSQVIANPSRLEVSGAGG